MPYYYHQKFENEFLKIESPISSLDDAICIDISEYFIKLSRKGPIRPWYLLNFYFPFLIFMCSPVLLELTVFNLFS